MKRICVIVSMLMLLLAVSPAAVAQYIPAPVEISSRTTTIDGNTYYEHTVEGRQTLYSICKAYGASLDEVTELNLEKLSGGLKAGSVLLIPYSGDVAALPEETAVGTAESVENDSQPAEEGKYLMHRVKWYDSLLMLSLKYKVSQQQIMELNNLSSKTLVVGQYLKIPVAGSDVTVADNTILDDEQDDMLDGDSEDGITIVSDIQDADDDSGQDLVPFVPFNGTARIALVLPLAASSGAPASNFLDFYAGILMALNQIKEEGINVNLKVIDMDSYGSFDQMALSTHLDSYDFIIGHFSIDEIDVAADFCDRNHIPLFSPMDQKLERATYRHPYLVNVPLSASTQALRLAESIGFNQYEDNIIVLCENGEELGQFHNDIIGSLDYLELPYSIAHSGIGRQGSANVGGLLDSGKMNHIIITSEKESLASDAVRNTGLLSRDGKYRVTGYASQKVRRFDSIDPESFQGMNAHFCLGYYVDYSNEDTRNFVRRYRALYNAEPGPYAFQGYDIAEYAVRALEKYGSDMINGIANFRYSGLQLNFSFDRRTPGGGMFNEAARNLVYKEGEVILCR